MPAAAASPSAWAAEPWQRVRSTAKRSAAPPFEGSVELFSPKNSLAMRGQERSPILRLQHALHEIVLQALHVGAADAMAGMRVEHHLEIAIRLLQRVGQLDGARHVDVVVHHAVDEQ